MARPLNWTARYIGVPFVDGGRVRANGLDCWGLVYSVFSEVLGVELPKWDTVTPQSADAIIREQREQPEWLPIALAETKDFDVVEMRDVFMDANGIRRHGRVHCGLIVAAYGGRRVLHCERATGVVSVPLSVLLKRAPNAFRHRSQA